LKILITGLMIKFVFGKIKKLIQFMSMSSMYYDIPWIFPTLQRMHSPNFFKHLNYDFIEFCNLNIGQYTITHHIVTPIYMHVWSQCTHIPKLTIMLMNWSIRNTLFDLNLHWITYSQTYFSWIHITILSDLVCVSCPKTSL